MVVCAAAVGVLKVPAAHGEHGTAAVTAFQKAGVGVVVFLLPTVMVRGPVLPQGFHRGEGTVVDNGLVVALDDDVIRRVPPHILAVDLPAGIFSLAEGTDIKIVVQDALHRDDGPGGLYGPAVVLPGSQLALPLRHAGGGDAFVRELVGDALVAPAVDIEPVNAAHDVGLGRDDLKLLALVDDVAVGRGANPLAVLLPPSDDGFYLFAGVGNRHLVDEELELYLQPVIVVGEVDVVADRDDTDTRVAEVFQLHKPPAVAAGEAGKVLDHQDLVVVGHEAPAHGLVALPLFKGVAGAVPVLMEGERAVGEFALHEVLNDGFLRCIV